MIFKFLRDPSLTVYRICGSVNSSQREVVKILKGVSEKIIKWEKLQLLSSWQLHSIGPLKINNKSINLMECKLSSAA